MQIDIWSDIMCPFCYIGKRRLEAAMDQFPHKEEINISWHSFQLNPDLEKEANKDLYTYLAEMKGQTREWSVKMHENLVQTARECGLDYNFDKARIANSFDAHRVIQFAKSKGLDDAMEERFFHAYFTEGALMSDHETLIKLATEIGLNSEELRQVLSSDAYSSEVEKDINDAAQLGIRGVPFFVFDMKYAVSGAQPVEVFTQVLEKAFEEKQTT